MGFLHTGRFGRGGGDTDGYGIDAALVAGFPIGSNSAIFGKLGTIYSRMDVNGNSAACTRRAASVTGARATASAARSASRRNGRCAPTGIASRLPLPGGREDLDTVMLGVQYTFR